MSRKDIRTPREQSEMRGPNYWEEIVVTSPHAPTDRSDHCRTPLLKAALEAPHHEGLRT